MRVMALTNMYVLQSKKQIIWSWPIINQTHDTAFFHCGHWKLGVQFVELSVSPYK